MRAAPALHIDVERFSVARAGLASLLLMAMLALAGWLFAAREDLTARHGVLAALAALTLIAAASRLRFRAFRLRWDGECWHVGPLPAAQVAPWSGRVGVALDFGGWLLLRFQPESGPRRCAYRWLAVQRRGLEAPWHALRCAVYCARPERTHHLASSAATRPDTTE